MARPCGHSISRQVLFGGSWEGGVGKRGDSLLLPLLPADTPLMLTFPLFPSSSISSTLSFIQPLDIVELPGQDLCSLSTLLSLFSIFSASLLPLNPQMSPGYRVLLGAGTLPLGFHGPLPLTCPLWLSLGFPALCSLQHAACHIIGNLVNICAMKEGARDSPHRLPLPLSPSFLAKCKLSPKLCSSGCPSPSPHLSSLAWITARRDTPAYLRGIPATGTYNFPLRIHLWLLLPHINIQHPWLAVHRSPS